MRVLIFMDNPSIQTGYAYTCRLTAKELVARGHETYAMAFNGGWSADAISDWYDVKIVPNYAIKRDGNAIYGDFECLRQAYDEVKPDVMLFHNDSYRYSYLKQMTPEMQEKSVFWLPFEGDVADRGGVEIFSKCAATRFVTRHALDVNSPGMPDLDVGVIYHAVDASERPYPKDEAKARHIKPRLDALGKANDPSKVFVVSRVDRHQPRKYWNLTLEAFAKFAKGKDDVLLLAKCNPRDCTMWDSAKNAGTDLEALANQLDLKGKVSFDDFFFNPTCMAQSFYWPADVFLTTTSGEGFGLAPVEAMSHGVPVIAPLTPVLPEVLGDGAIFCKVKERVWYDKMSVFHNIVDVDDVAEKLESAYQDWKSGGKMLAEVGRKGRDLAASRYSPKIVYDQWDQVLRDVKERRELATLVTVLYNVTGEEQLYGDDGIDKLRETMEKHVTYPYEWIIVDNGSPARQETRDWMEKAAAGNKRIKPLLLDQNLGFAGANNKAISMAKGKNVILVNPDGEAINPAKHGLTKDWVRILVERADTDKSIGVVGMKLNERDDILKGLVFPYFCCVLLTKACLDAVKLSEGKWLDEAFWPAYYEDSDLCWRIQGKGFKIVEQDVPFWHKSGGTNKHAIEGGAKGEVAGMLMRDLEARAKADPMGADWGRKRVELANEGMQGLIGGNIRYLQSKWGESARKKIRVVWQTKIGSCYGFSEIAEGLIPKLHEMGFDVYVNDWGNGSDIKDPVIKQLHEKTKLAKENGDDLYDAINIVCWLMETFLGVDAGYKVGISLCESTKVRESYLQACNSMDRILTFSEFCKRVQLDSGFKSPIHVIPPGVDPTYMKLASRPAKDFSKDKFTFLNVGVCQERKDTRRLVEAFCEAFPKDAPHIPEGPGYPIKPSQVELVIKSNNFGDLSWISEPRKDGPPLDERANVRGIFTGDDERAKGRKNFTKEEMYDLYAGADAAVFPSHGEGIGMSQLESAATGCPLIFTNWSSPAEYFNDENSYPISPSPYPGTTLTKAYPGAPGDNGVWANCFTAGTPVRTIDGMRPIEEIKEGDLVLTHKGRYRRVLKTSARVYKGRMIAIRGLHNRHVIMATPEHPFLCVKTDKCKRKGRSHVTCKQSCYKACPDGHWNDYRLEFVDAKDLRTRDALVLPFIKDERPMEDIDLLKFYPTASYDDRSIWLEKPSFAERMNPERKTIEDVAKSADISRSVAQRSISGKGSASSRARAAAQKALGEIGYQKPQDFKRLNRFVRIDEKFARTCGFYLAEGHSNGSRVSFSLHAREMDYASEIMDTMREKFGIEGKIVQNGKNGIQVYFLSAILVKFFRKTFGIGARRKGMPSSWAYLPGILAKGVLYGLWRGDGCVEKGSFSFKTSSSKLAYQSSALCLKIGIETSIYTNMIGQYILKAHEQESRTRASLVLERKDFHRSPKARTWRDEDYVYLPIREIKESSCDGLVYNLEVDEDNTYCVANAIVHNCHIGHLKFLMYHVLKERDEALAKGRRAYEHVKANFTWEKSAKALAPLLFEWDADRKGKASRNEFDPATFVKPVIEPVKPGDRVMMDVVTRDRRPYLSVLICSLLHQTFKDWDMIIEVDDADENILHDHLVMSLLARARHEGHDWRMIRSHRQGPHMAHDRTLFMTHENPGRKYKLLCRVDDDIYLEPTYLEKLFGVFLEDAGCDVAAVGGTYPDPKRPRKDQTPPPGWEKDINYAGKIDHNVPWPYVCFYPEGTKPRLVEHLYSSFMFRVEVGVAIGGYCKLFSQIGHREESDFSCRFHFAGYKQYIHPEAVGFHFQAPAGGIRSDDIGPNKGELAGGDHKIYERRLAKWKRSVLKKKAPTPKATSGDETKTPAPQPGSTAGTRPATPKLIAVINGGPDVNVLQEAVTRASEFADEIYVTTPNPLCRAKIRGEKLRMTCCSKEETSTLSMALAKSDDYVMTIKDTYRFTSDPRAVLVDWMDDYVFEVHKTYDKDGRVLIGPELRNECLISRRSNPTMGVDVSKVQYCDLMVLDDRKIDGKSCKSTSGLDLVPLDQVDKSSWVKVCVHQFPEGDLNPPRSVLVESPVKDIVSIVIPTAGRLAMLRRCVDSIFSHTSTPFELIVVDNGSNDGTREYLEKESIKRPSIRFARNSTNLGFQRAANMGVSMSRGKYVLLFNDDAWVEGKEPDGRDWLSVYADELEADPRLGLVGPHAPDGGTSPTLGTPMLFFWCVMTRRSTWDEIGQLDDVSFFNYGGDDDWCERLRAKGYSVKAKPTKLRHLMTCVPEHVKQKELAESRAKLVAKYKVTSCRECPTP